MSPAERLGLFYLPEYSTKGTRPLHRKRASFFVLFLQREANTMNDCISRLVRCGVPEKTARCLVLDFARLHQFAALYLYVQQMEAACGVA